MRSEPRKTWGGRWVNWAVLLLVLAVGGLLSCSDGEPEGTGLAGGTDVDGRAADEVVTEFLMALQEEDWGRAEELLSRDGASPPSALFEALSSTDESLSEFEVVEVRVVDDTRAELDVDVTVTGSGGIGRAILHEQWLVIEEGGSWRLSGEPAP